MGISQIYPCLSSEIRIQQHTTILDYYPRYPPNASIWFTVDNVVAGATFGPSAHDAGDIDLRRLLEFAFSNEDNKRSPSTCMFAKSKKYTSYLLSNLVKLWPLSENLVAIDGRVCLLTIDVASLNKSTFGTKCRCTSCLLICTRLGPKIQSW